MKHTLPGWLARIFARFAPPLGIALALAVCSDVAPAQTPPPAAGYQAIDLRQERAADVAQMLERSLGGRVQAVVDPNANRLYLRGGEADVQTARAMIVELDRPVRQATAVAAAPRTQPAGGMNPLRAAVQHVAPQVADRQAAGVGPGRAQGAAPLNRSERIAIAWPPAEVESALARLFGTRLQRTQRGGEFAITSKDGRGVMLRIDPAGGGLWCNGPEPLVSQVMKLVAAHQRPQQTATGSTRAIALGRADSNQVNQVAQIYSRGNAKGQRAAATQLAQAPPPPPAGQPPLPPAPTEEDLRGANERLRELGLDLDVEVLPDLDAIILRGNNRDVNEMLRIIEDIERISAETKPEVEVVELKHVSSEALAPLLLTVQRDLLAGRPGQVSIASLNRPNAILLVGWGEAIQSVRELITKLDREVEPQTQLRVFRLKHAPAAATATMVEQSFATPTGLGTRLVVTPDIRSNALIVQAAPRDMAEIEALLARIDTGHSDAVNVVRIFKLRNSLANDLSETLQAAIGSARTGPGAGAAAAAAGAKSSVLELLTVDPLGQKVLKSGILADVKITPDVRANSLVVTAPAQSMDLIAALIAQMDDSAASVAQIKVFQVVNGDASSLVLMLRTLLPQQTATGQGPPLPRAEGESSFTPLRYSVDLRTNSIIAAGSAGDLAIIEALLLRLDERDVQQRKNAVYQLKNAPALDVADAINQFLRSERTVQEAAPGEASPFQQIEREAVVVPEPVGNLLIISASPRFFDEIYRMVEDIDAQPPQVLIQVLIAEVALTENTEFGVEWGLQDGLLFDRSLLGDLLTTTSSTTFGNPPTTVQEQTVVSATQQPGFDFNSPLIGNSGSARSLATAAQTGKQALANFAVGRTNTELGFGGLVLSAGSKSINVLLRALQQNQRLEVLSRPQVMTIDNQPAFIQVGQRVPLITNVIVNQIGQTNTVQMDNVGLILGVTPRISPDGMVVMEVDAEKSDVAPEIEGIPVSISASGDVVRAPRINITTAQTTVSTASGETIVLGGLITKRRLTINRRVPYLASVPVLGWMFRYDQYEAQRTELLIILTPHVVRNAADAERLRQIEAARMHWCAADVHALHGDPAFCRKGECPVCNADMPVIYPDFDPSGLEPTAIPLDGELVPDEITPAQPETLPESLPEAPGPGEAAQEDKKPKSKWRISSLLPKKKPKAKSEPEVESVVNDPHGLPKLGPFPASPVAHHVP